MTGKWELTPSEREKGGEGTDIESVTTITRACEKQCRDVWNLTMCRGSKRPPSNFHHGQGGCEKLVFGGGENLIIFHQDKGVVKICFRRSLLAVQN